MRLDIFRSLWGATTDWPTCVRQLREAGCVGIEARLPPTRGQRQQLRARLNEEGLAYIGIVFSGGDVVPRQQDTPEQHLDHLARMLEAADALAPRFINVLAGNDRWPLAQQVDFFGRALALADAAAVVCSFETHRATSLYSPWLTLELIRQVPELRFTADISHWVVVAERLPDHPLDDFQPFIDRVHHIQARVGYAQGPQVPHPAAPEYSAELAFHQAFWQAVWHAQRNQGYPVATLTPEFGPDGYLHHLPFTDVPVTDLWSLNDWMARCERQHFERWLQHSPVPT
ncbi:TIM barrel protein [Affinibrenneria salicis]|uniref:TIM barrel protein n=1 Tax=Affinibrenneria salicis TaxID=2590031 RepID=A0A5J5FYX5_9GAMM|nr:TIM barrel protein [Affinibrenneria salicis]KAA8999309.1 TIM barrel protein [Affinibrenneria salicis]